MPGELSSSEAEGLGADPDGHLAQLSWRRGPGGEGGVTCNVIKTTQGRGNFWQWLLSCKILPSSATGISHYVPFVLNRRSPLKSQISNLIIYFILNNI